MGVFYETIPASLIPWLLNQPLFYISTAPLSPLGHVNVSPKGGKYFGIPSPTLFWYLDLSGSGAETLSHLHEPGNGRITVLFNAFDGPPKIVRLWGQGEVLEYGTSEYEAFKKQHGVNTIEGTRSIIVVKIHQVGSSCGFSVPKFEFQEFRETLNEFAVKKIRNDEAGKRDDGMERYWAFKNSYSMDGIPAMKRGLATMHADSVKPIKKMVGPYAEIATKTRSSSRTVPAWSLTAAIMLSFLLGVLATVVLQGELGLRREVWWRS